MNLEQTLHQLYNLTVKSIDVIAAGNTNKNRIVTCEQEEKYFLKEYSEAEPKRIKIIHEVLKRFEIAGVPALLPIENINGRTLFELNRRYYTLFNLIDHEEPQRGELTNGQIKNCAIILARLHHASKDIDRSGLVEYRGWSRKVTLNRLDEFVNDLKDPNRSNPVEDIVLKHIAKTRSLIEEGHEEYKPKLLGDAGIIHGDFHSENVMFQGDDVVKVIDFERVMVAPFMHEFTMATIGSFVYEHFDERALQQIRIFTGAYLKKFPVPREVFENGWDHYYQFFLHSTWSLDQRFSKQKLSATYNVMINIARQNFLDEHLEDLKNMWTKNK